MFSLKYTATTRTKMPSAHDPDTPGLLRKYHHKRQTMTARRVLEEAISQAVIETKLSLSLQQENNRVCRLREQNIHKKKVEK